MTGSRRKNRSLKTRKTPSWQRASRVQRNLDEIRRLRNQFEKEVSKVVFSSLRQALHNVFALQLASSRGVQLASEPEGDELESTASSQVDRLTPQSTDNQSFVGDDECEGEASGSGEDEDEDDPSYSDEEMRQERRVYHDFLFDRGGAHSLRIRDNLPLLQGVTTFGSRAHESGSHGSTPPPLSKYEFLRMLKALDEVCDDEELRRFDLELVEKLFDRAYGTATPSNPPQDECVPLLVRELRAQLKSGHIDPLVEEEELDAGRT